MRIEISNTILFRLPTPATISPFLLESSAFGTIVMTPQGHEMFGGRDTRVLQSTRTAPGIHSVTIEFDYPEDAPLELHLGGVRGGEARNPEREAYREGSITARLSGLRAVHALRVEPEDSIVHLRHAALAGAAPCQLICPDGLVAQGPNHCIDCRTAIGTVTICC